VSLLKRCVCSLYGMNECIKKLNLNPKHVTCVHDQKFMLIIALCIHLQYSTFTVQAGRQAVIRWKGVIILPPAV
jgi:hypothetical protein